MKRSVLVIIVLLLTIFMHHQAYGADKVYNFKGGVKTRADKGLSNERVAPTYPDNWFSTWTYTFILIMDDGSSATVQFTYWKVYLASRGGINVSYIDKGEDQVINSQVFDMDKLEYDHDNHRFQVGPHYWEGEYPDYRIHLDIPAQNGKPAMKADIKLRSLVKGWRPGEGPVHYGAPDGSWYDLVVPIPWADLSGSFYINNKKHELKGYAYMDHNTQTVMPTEQLGKIIALRSFSDEYAVNFLEYIAPDSYGNTRSTWILVMKNGEILYATDDWERTMGDFREEKRTGYTYPSTLEVKINKPGIKLIGTVRGQKLIEIVEPLEELPDWVLKVARKFFKAPAIIRQNVEVDWHLKMPEEGIDKKFRCNGVFENSIIR